MGLVDYSDSDASGSETSSAPKLTNNTSKAAFQKVVDRSNPGKIKVSLPKAAVKEDATSDEPPAKRAKMNGGGFGGFNSFLPAPKRAGLAANASGGGGNTAKKGGGLGAGVSLKTGAAPGFSRDAAMDMDFPEYDDGDEHKPTDSGYGSSLPAPKALSGGEQKPVEEVKLVGKPLIFKPLSVSRKPAKKKKPVVASASSEPTIATAPQVETPVPKPKVSLFSMSEDVSTPIQQTSNGEYKPMILDGFSGKGEDDEPSYEEFTPNTSFSVPPAVPTPPVSQSLEDIAGDLNLSAAERRQLFGRQKSGQGAHTATNIINFNTDKEYLHNEELRASGEQITHNPVRSIAPGKHSLKQLVNAAQSQKEALEESFAKGKNNRAEASSRYGW